MPPLLPAIRWASCPDKVLVEASGSMIKNVKSVIVPNTDNMKGLEAAAAAGIVAGKQERSWRSLPM